MKAGNWNGTGSEPSNDQGDAMQDKAANQQVDGVLTETVFTRNHTDQVKDGGDEIDQQGDFKQQNICRHDKTSRKISPESSREIVSTRIRVSKLLIQFYVQHDKIG